jgi:hypothetical protein
VATGSEGEVVAAAVGAVMVLVGRVTVAVAASALAAMVPSAAVVRAAAMAA